MRDADQIAVPAGGRIAQIGTHDELVARPGEYARLLGVTPGGGQLTAVPSAVS